MLSAKNKCIYYKVKLKKILKLHRTFLKALEKSKGCLLTEKQNGQYKTTAEMGKLKLFLWGYVYGFHEI